MKNWNNNTRSLELRVIWSKSVPQKRSEHQNFFAASKLKGVNPKWLQSSFLASRSLVSSAAFSVKGHALDLNKKKSSEVNYEQRV